MRTSPFALNRRPAPFTLRDALNLPKQVGICVVVWVVISLLMVIRTLGWRLSNGECLVIAVDNVMGDNGTKTVGHDYVSTTSPP